VRGKGRDREVGEKREEGGRQEVCEPLHKEASSLCMGRAMPSAVPTRNLAIHALPLHVACPHLLQHQSSASAMMVIVATEQPSPLHLIVV
jgi:hypothetical protein